MRFRKITIIGVGLLGGSIGLAARQRRLAAEVAGFVRREASLKDCEAVGAVDYATTDMLAAVSNADLVILCTPLSQMPARVLEMLPSLKRGAVVTDVGSAKTGVVKDVCGLIRRAGAHFIGSHPMAGAEKTGVRAARADLFEKAVCVLTPTKNSNRTALRTIEQFWKSLGCQTIRLTPQLHDQIVSRSSHLPHVVAAALANWVLDPSRPKAQAQLCATGFRDTTRIASGSPEMWRDIALSNRTNLARSLDEFVAGLQKFRRILKNADEKAIAGYFETAKTRRDNWCADADSISSE